MTFCLSVLFFFVFFLLIDIFQLEANKLQRDKQRERERKNNRRCSYFEKAMFEIGGIHGAARLLEFDFDGQEDLFPEDQIGIEDVLNIGKQLVHVDISQEAVALRRLEDHHAGHEDIGHGEDLTYVGDFGGEHFVDCLLLKFDRFQHELNRRTKKRPVRVMTRVYTEAKGR